MFIDLRRLNEKELKAKKIIDDYEIDISTLLITFEKSFGKVTPYERLEKLDKFYYTETPRDYFIIYRTLERVSIWYDNNTKRVENLIIKGFRNSYDLRMYLRELKKTINDIKDLFENKDDLENGLKSINSVLKTPINTYSDSKIDKKIEDENLNNSLIKPKEKKQLYFISHSSKDAKIVKNLAYLINDLGVKNEKIVCTSVPEFGVKHGENIIEFLKQSFEYDITVIYVISKNYFNSRYCLNEMGAAWIKQTDKIIVKLDDEEIKDCVLSSSDFYSKYDQDGAHQIYEYLLEKGAIKPIESVELRSKINRNID
ncbi:toll/interleukin-1 receptor domain-containing protein [Mammaliicoccus sciuri]|uniref:toll/interleukin-1 receptor domain-containing protein n=1 Tax=Mammaliicoccus sciuri TaxID=1296 RepID=UPI0034DD2DD1